MTDHPPEKMDVEKMARVGAVVIAWAFIEYAMERVLWGLTNLPDDHGRILTSHMQWGAKEATIRELLANDSSELAEKIRFNLKALEDLATARNKLAHGIWVRDHVSGALMITSTRKKPAPVPAAKGKPAARPRERGIFSVEPMTDEQLDDLRNTMTEIGEDFMEAADELALRRGSPSRPLFA